MKRRKLGKGRIIRKKISEIIKFQPLKNKREILYYCQSLSYKLLLTNKQLLVNFSNTSIERYSPGVGVYCGLCKAYKDITVTNISNMKKGDVRDGEYELYQLATSIISNRTPKSDRVFSRRATRILQIFKWALKANHYHNGDVSTKKQFYGEMCSFHGDFCKCF
jgi:hypothetical protein